MLKRPALTLGLVLVGAAAQAADKQPNVVFILTDNLGCGEIGWHGDRHHHAPSALHIQGQPDPASSKASS